MYHKSSMLRGRDGVLTVAHSLDKVLEGFSQFARLCGDTHTQKRSEFTQKRLNGAIVFRSVAWRQEVTHLHHLREAATVSHLGRTNARSESESINTHTHTHTHTQTHTDAHRHTQTHTHRPTQTHTDAR